jgi:hypothetical protein
MTRYKLSIRRAPNQDAETVLLIRYNDDGTSAYVKGLVWQAFRNFDVLDITEVTFPGGLLLEGPDFEKARKVG